MRQYLNWAETLVDPSKPFLNGGRRTSKGGETSEETFVRLHVGGGDRMGAAGDGETSTEEKEMYLAPPTARSGAHMIPV